MDRTPVIIGLGLQTAIGLGLPANVAAVRAGLNAFRMSNYLRGYKAAERLKVSQLSTLSRDLPIADRMRTMVSAAAQEALSTLLKALPTGNAPEIPVLLAVPANRPGLTPDFGQKRFQQLVAALPIPVDRKRSVIVNTGNDGGLAALDYATQMIRTGSMDYCLVGGVDSYFDIDTLHWLEAQDRLRLDEQPNGFIPGEGAAFVLLCSRERAYKTGLSSRAELVSTGRGDEQRLCFTDMPNLGEGLTHALRAALDSEHCPPQKLTATYSDLNGESWRAEEWGYAFVRTGERHASPIQMRHPAACWGDLGAASGTALVALATAELNYSLHGQDLILVWAASDWHPSRSACVLRAASGGTA